MNDHAIEDAARRATELAARGRAGDGYNLLLQAVGSGDGYAAATLADWRMAGEFIRRDLTEARQLYGRALLLGVDEACGPYVALLASGAGGSGRDWQGALRLLEARQGWDAAARDQLSLLNAMPLSPQGEPQSTYHPQTLATHPRIEQLPAFLTAAECEYLQRIAAVHLAPALIVDPRTGALRRDPARLARSAAFPFVTEDPVLHAINRRIAAATGTRWEQGEPAQVLAYDPGEEYRLHSDTLPPGGPQRIITFLVALNEDYEGGETSFPAIDLSWRGRRGDALMFHNVGSDGLPVAAAQHAGRPVRRGSKFILSRWIRERPLDLSGPPGRPF